MGTRHLVKVIKDKRVVVAQYGQFDGYPSGAGIIALRFLNGEGNIDKLSHNVDVCWPASDRLYAEVREQMGIPENGWMTIDQSKAYELLYPSLHRNTGANILRVIAENSEGVPLSLDTEFENDTTFCEAVYSVDLDRGVFSSVWENVTVSYSFDQLPTEEEYLAKFAEAGVYV